METLSPLPSSPLYLPFSRQPLICCDYRLVFYLLEFYKNWITQYVFFFWVSYIVFQDSSMWLCVSILLSFLLLNDLLLHGYSTIYIHSPVDGHFLLFPVFRYYKYCTEHLCTSLCVDICFISFGKIT